MADILLFPLRLLVFLLRLPVALIDVLVFFLYALVLYIGAIPALLLNAVYQIVLLPFRLARGEDGWGRFRPGWFLLEPAAMFVRKTRAIAAWLGDSWTTFQSKKRREEARRRMKNRYQAYLQREEPVLSVPMGGGPPRLTSVADAVPETDATWPCKGDEPKGRVALSCPHCAEPVEDEYPVRHEGAVVFQFTEDPGDQYTGGDSCGVVRCERCGGSSYMVEVTEDKGVFNCKTKRWETNPDLAAMPVAEVSARF